MKKTIMFNLLFYSMFVIAQDSTVVNVKGKWFFGGELGKNTIRSYEFGESANSFQAGLLAEYYFSKQWSVVGRIKYFKIGASFSGDDFIIFPNKAVYNFGRFNGESLSIPVTLKWEFKIYKNFRGYLKIGSGISIETRSEYRDYAPEITDNFKSYYLNFNLGYGITYFLNKNNALYLDTEIFAGGSKGKQDGLYIFGDGSKVLVNEMINLGYKHNF
ncbi:outer membrane beta-barrel protein [Flavobacterium sp. 25HG05S-40]|uniref:outer membrane beta-barrel protein n=1 Tax=Flavobacterium sp. 25HG05S-40 TaxID=3458682 RepID=UPI004045057B